MIYILMIWTTVAAWGTGTGNYNPTNIKDWRPLGEFQAELSNSGFQTSKTAQQMCEDAARQLGLKTENYRCIRSR